MILSTCTANILYYTIVMMKLYTSTKSSIGASARIRFFHGNNKSLLIPSVKHFRSPRKRMTSPCKSSMLIEVSTAADHLDVDVLLRQMLHIADAATTATTTTTDPQDNGWLTPLVDTLELVLRFIQDNLDKYHVPYSKGWSIVALTAFVKLLTFPLTKIQVESSLSVQTLKPKIDAIKEKYGEDKTAVQRETSALYEKAGVNPLAGCLPSIATIPIFIGLYRSLTSVAAQGQLDNEGFYWVPSLAGPTSVAAQRAGTGAAWLFPFVDGQPPVGWDTASKYLVLPIALVIAQYISSAIISPPIDPNSDNAKVQKAIYVYAPCVCVCVSLRNNDIPLMNAHYVTHCVHSML